MKHLTLDFENREYKQVEFDIIEPQSTLDICMHFNCSRIKNRDDEILVEDCNIF